MVPRQAHTHATAAILYNVMLCEQTHLQQWVSGECARTTCLSYGPAGTNCIPCNYYICIMLHVIALMLLLP